MADGKPTKHKQANGPAAGTAVWQAVNGNSGGNWSQAGHWVGGTIGAAGLVVDLGPANVALAGSYVITATNEAALDLNVQLYQGTLAVAGTLQVADTLAVTGGTFVVDGAVVDSGAGTVDYDGSFEHGVLLLRDDGTWNAGSLEIAAAGTGDAVLGNGSAGTGGTLNISGLLDVGADSQPFTGGILSLSGGSRVVAATLDVLGQSVVSLDPTSTMSVGTSATVAGAILIGAGATMDAAGSTLEANVIDDGTLLADSPIPNELVEGPTIVGTLSGDGSVPVQHVLTVSNAAAFTGAFSLADGADLVVGSGGLPLATVAMQDATVDLQGVQVAAPVYTAATGLLVVGSATLNVGTGFSQDDFTTTSDNQGGVLISEHPNDNWIASGTVETGNWTNTAHWSDGALPAADTTVEIGDGLPDTDFTVTVNTTAAVAAVLQATAGEIVITGSLAVGDAMNVAGANVTVANGGALSAAVLEDPGGLVQVNDGVLTTPYATIEYGVFVQDGGVWTAGTVVGADADFFLQNGSTDLGGTLDVSGTLEIGVLSTTGGSAARAGVLQMDQGGQVTLDSTSFVAIGGAAATDGALAIGPSGTLTAHEQASVLGNLIDNGLLGVSANEGPGSLQVQGTLSGAGQVALSQSALEVSSAVNFSGAITLDQATLTLDAGGAKHALLQMADGGTVDLRGQTVPAQLGYNGVSGLLTVGATTLDVGQGFAAVDFSAVTDNDNGTLVTQTSTVPCYVAGTRIATAFGAVPVEALRPGDHVRTASGRLAPVVWVGRTRIDLLRHPAPRAAAPIRFAAGAIGPGLPQRDLLVSPDHALAVGGFLVPARLLANGGSIASVADLPSVSYVHVELDRHDLVVAEGVAAESFLDTGNRGMFAEAQGVRPLFPDFCATEADSVRAFAERGCAPLLLDGPVVLAEHARLLARAVALGHRLSEDADLRIEADHPATEAEPRPDGVALRLPAAIHRLRLRSRSFVPAEFDPARRDGRVLGAMLSLRLGGKSLPAPAFAFGWHDAEDGGEWRWTDGDAALVLDLRRPAVLRVRLRPVGAQYWLERPAADRARAAVTRARRQ